MPITAPKPVAATVAPSPSSFGSKPVAMTSTLQLPAKPDVVQPKPQQPVVGGQKKLVGKEKASDTFTASFQEEVIALICKF